MVPQAIERCDRVVEFWRKPAFWSVHLEIATGGTEFWWRPERAGGNALDHASEMVGYCWILFCFILFIFIGYICN